MKSVYIACAFVAAAILFFTGYSAYKNYLSHKKLITASGSLRLWSAKQPDIRS
jgi:hypothetical protein